MTAPTHDERAERLLLGQVIAHPDRFAEVHVTAEHFHGICRELYAALVAQVQGGALDVGALPPRLFRIACDLIEEWQDYNTAPLALSGLCRRLEYHAARRRLAVLAATAEQLVAETTCTPAAFALALRDLAAQVVALADEYGRGPA